MTKKRLSTSSAVLVLLMFLVQHGSSSSQQVRGFVGTNGTHFVKNDKHVYLIGFNAYWMMYMASIDSASRAKVTSAFEQAKKCGMNVARTWGFSDGGSDRPLQVSPGSYNEEMFKGLDFVISEAGRHGIYVILSLVNNFKDYGGKPQYVKWASELGQKVSTEDDFYTNPTIKNFYKNHAKAVVTRVNTITGMTYKDDPTIFAWELMNEPRSSDTSGKIIQEWVQEMAAHVKSIDGNHLLEIGCEGFYGESQKQSNPNSYLVGTDFINNNRISDIDFATIHLYPEHWLPQSSEEEQAAFVSNWIQVHVRDSISILNKPVLIAEFGKSSQLSGYSLQKRDSYFGKIYDEIYTSVRNGGSFCGGLFWQLMAPGMDGWGDGYQIVLEENPSTANLIAQQSRKLSLLS